MYGVYYFARRLLWTRSRHARVNKRPLKARYFLVAHTHHSKKKKKKIPHRKHFHSAQWCTRTEKHVLHLSVSSSLLCGHSVAIYYDQFIFTLCALCRHAINQTAQSFSYLLPIYLTHHETCDYLGDGSFLNSNPDMAGLFTPKVCCAHMSGSGAEVGYIL